MAIGILGVLSITGATLIYLLELETRRQRERLLQGQRTAPTPLAEAGPRRTALSGAQQCAEPTHGHRSLQSTTLPDLEGGSVTYSGTLNGTSVDDHVDRRRHQPDGRGGRSSWTLTRTRARSTASNSGANVAAWNRWYSRTSNELSDGRGRDDYDAARQRGGLCLVGSGPGYGSGTTRRGRRERDDDRRTEHLAARSQPERGHRLDDLERTSSRATTPTRPPRSARAPRAQNLDSTGFGFSIPTTGDRHRHPGRRSSGRRAAHLASRTTNVHVLKGGSATGITDHADHGDWATSDDDAVLRRARATSGARPGRRPTSTPRTSGFGSRRST